MPDLNGRYIDVGGSSPVNVPTTYLDVSVANQDTAVPSKVAAHASANADR